MHYKAKPMHKYKILDYLNALPYDQRKKAVDEIQENLGIGRRQFYNILNARQQESREAKPSQLKTIADYFGITIDDLINEQVQEQVLS
jgi:hypothetical protein